MCESHGASKQCALMGFLIFHAVKVSVQVQCGGFRGFGSLREAKTEANPFLCYSPSSSKKTSQVSSRIKVLPQVTEMLSREVWFSLLLPQCVPKMTRKCRKHFQTSKMKPRMAVLQLRANGVSRSTALQTLRWLPIQKPGYAFLLWICVSLKICFHPLFFHKFCRKLLFDGNPD